MSFCPISLRAVTTKPPGWVVFVTQNRTKDYGHNVEAAGTAPVFFAVPAESTQ